MKAIIRTSWISVLALTDAPRRWRIRSIAAFAVLIGISAAGYALMFAAFDAVIKTGT